MPKITYRAQTESDPTHTQVGPHCFEHGKAVEVDDATHERLSKNPWFKGGRVAREQAEEFAAGTGNDGASRDSSIHVAMPPGQGSKYPGAEFVVTGDGTVPAEDASLVDGANTTEDGGEEPRRRGRPPKNG